MDKINCQPPCSRATADTRNDLTREAARESVLVVDDEINFLTLLRWFLSQRGYAVATASSADEALALLDRQSFKVALLDVRLGNVDGIDLLEQLIQCAPEIKVIMMTAYPTVASIKLAFDKGAVRYLTKPVDLPELAEAIRLVL